MVRVPLLVGFAGVGSTVVPWAATPLQWPSSAATPLAVLCTLIGEELVLQLKLDFFFDMGHERNVLCDKNET